MKKLISSIGLLILLSLGLNQASAETVAGNVTADTTWTKEGSPYKVNIIEVSPGATLTVEPGVEIIGVNGGPAWIDVKGKIKVQGTADERVTIKDVIIKGFNWQGSSVSLEYASLSRTYAGGFLVTSADQEVILRNNIFTGGDVILGEPKVDILIEDNLFQQGTQLSMSNGPADILVKRNTFFNTGDSSAAIQLYSNTAGPNTTITENNFFGYPSFFIEVLGGKGLQFDGTNNYWNTTATSGMTSRLLDGAREPYSTRAVINYSPIAYKPFANGHPLGEMENPGVHKIGDSDAFVTGYTDADSEVKVWKNDSLIGEGTSGADGTYKVAIPVQKAGTLLTIKAVDSFGRYSSGTVTPVADTTAPQAPMVNKVTDQSTKVEGSTEPSTTVIVIVDGIQKRGTADDKGDFSVEITPQKAGAVIEVQAMDATANRSEFTRVTVIDGMPPAKPVITSEELTDQSTYVQGTAEPRALVKLLQDGILLGSLFADDFGQFTFDLKQAFKGGATIKITAEDQAGNISEPVIFTVRDLTPPTLDIDWEKYVTEKSTEVYGTAEPGSKIEILKNATVIGFGSAKTDGTFVVAIPVQTPGTELILRATDTAGNERSMKVTVIDLPDPLPLTINPINTLSTSISGETAPNVFVNIEMNGVRHVVQADVNGNFIFSISPQKEGSTIYFLANNEQGQYSEQLAVKVAWKAPSGWYKDSAGYWYYYDPNTGVLKTGWLLYKTKWYYLEADGKMKVGWKKIGTTWYYLNADGTMRVGWLSYGGKWYYFPASGKMQTGIASISGKWYYFNSDGAMQTGWQKVNDKWYYFNTSGAGQIGWAKISGKWYYFNSNAIMQTGWVTINNKRYYFNSSGVWLY